MTEPLIFVNTYAINPDRIETLRRGFGKTAELVRAEEPKMLYFGCHVSEDGTEATTVQVHADAGNMAFHHSTSSWSATTSAEPLNTSSSRRCASTFSGPQPTSSSRSCADLPARVRP